MTFSSLPVMVCLFVMLCLTSVRAADLKTSSDEYQKNKDDILQAFQPKFDDLQQKYQKSLEALKAFAQKQGDLAKTKAAVNEMDRFGKAKTMPAAAEKIEIQEIKDFQFAYVQEYAKLELDMTAKLGALTAKYEQFLDRLQKDLVKADKLDEATAVQEERQNALISIKGFADQLAALKGTASTNRTAASVSRTSAVRKDKISLVGRWHRDRRDWDFQFSEDGTFRCLNSDDHGKWSVGEDNTVRMDWMTGLEEDKVRLYTLNGDSVFRGRIRVGKEIFTRIKEAKAAKIGIRGEEHDVRANDDYPGVQLGKLKRGDRIVIQYVSGKWSAGGGAPETSPDEDPKAPVLSICTLNGVAGTVPMNTKTNPYSFEVPKDGAYFLHMRDVRTGAGYSDNTGVVRYRVEMR